MGSHVKGCAGIPLHLMVQGILESKREESPKPFVPLDKRKGGFVNVEEIAEYTGLSVKTIWREIEARNLPSRKIRSRVIVATSDVLAWLSARKEG